MTEIDVAEELGKYGVTDGAIEDFSRWYAERYADPSSAVVLFEAFQGGFDCGALEAVKATCGSIKEILSDLRP